jgi:hypothetical protein
MRTCPLSNQETKCTDHCKECAKECYYDLKSLSGKSECVSEEAIRSSLGDEAFMLMRQYGLIECCTTIQGNKMYAI